MTDPSTALELACYLAAVGIFFWLVVDMWRR